MSDPVYEAPFDMAPQQSPYEPEQLFQIPWADNPSPSSMAVDPGVFEAMSSFQPLSVRVGAIHESGNNPHTLG